jgi:hypothetical protein
MYLPPELLEEVMGYLANEPATLRACALAHRSRTRSSQCQLFQTVDVASPSKWPRLWRLLEENHHIRPMLRHLVLRCSFEEGAFARPHPVLFPRVTSLAYVDWHFETAVLDNFPALHALKFGVVYKVLENAQAADSCAFHCLKSLSIRGRPHEPILSWIHKIDFSKTLQELEIDVPNPHTLHIFRSVLQTLRALRKLKLHLNFKIWLLGAAGEFIRAVYGNSI